jgi:hypothetical protein
VSSTVANPPQTKAITTIIVIQVLVVIGVPFARRRPVDRLLEHSAAAHRYNVWSGKRPA